jgi:hypothetical protein
LIVFGSPDTISVCDQQSIKNEFRSDILPSAIYFGWEAHQITEPRH